VDKAPDAFRTISEVADELAVPQHVLRFWESRFHEIRPLKRGGGRRYYRPDDVDLLRGIRHLLYGEGYTIRGVQRILREQGLHFVQEVWQPGAPQPAHELVEHAADEAAESQPEVSRAPAATGRDLPQREDAGDHADERIGPSMGAPAQRGLPQEDLRKLADVLRQLGECRKLLDAALRASFARVESGGFPTACQ
jgi:DNA-binding transcriptional MerR regulator